MNLSVKRFVIVRGRESNLRRELQAIDLQFLRESNVVVEERRRCLFAYRPAKGT